MKPAKPRPDFPLFAHANGSWAKKHKGKLYFYGPWADPDGAEAKYLASPQAPTPTVTTVSGTGVETPKLPRSGKGDKPAKPYPGFPLYAHKTGRWAKTIRRMTHYFGPWSDWRGALEKWLAQKDALLAGLEPQEAVDGLTVADLANRFLTAKRRLVENDELKEVTFTDYRAICGTVVSVFGKGRLVESLGPHDFERLRAAFAKKHKPVRLCKDVQCTRTLFKYAEDLIDRPVKMGKDFKRPSKLTLTKARQKQDQKHGLRLFEPAQVRQIIEAAGTQLRAMILLGLNCGFGNEDCARLPFSALDLKQGWHNFPRPKTGIERRCHLWPETVEALEAAIKERPEPKDEDDRDLVFITRFGGAWKPKSGLDNAIAKEFAKLMAKVKLKRPGLTFYTLRRTFETIGGDSCDQVAVDFIMGHSPASGNMAAVYRQQVFDHRLVAVTEHVRTWLKSTESRQQAG